MTQLAEPQGLVLPRAVVILMGSAFATITVAGMRGIAGLVGPAFLALVIVTAAHPLRGWLQRHGLPGWAVNLVMIVTVYGFVLLFSAALVVAIARFATLLPTYQDEMTALVHNASRRLSDLGVGQDQIAAISGSFDLGKLAGVVYELLGGLLGVLSDLFFVVALMFFLVLDGAWFSRSLEETPTERRALVSALGSFAVGTRRYLIVSTVFGLIVAVLDSVALAVMGIPAPLLWGLLAFITNYIPNIGFLIGLIPAAVLGLLEGGPGLMLAVVAVYSVLNVVIQSVIQPKVVGDAVGLSPTLTFLSLVFWAFVLGALGALLAIPLSLFAKAVLVDIDPQTRWLGPLIGGAGAGRSTPTGRRG